MIAVTYLIIALLVVYCVYQVALLVKSRQMKARECQLMAKGIKPKVSHGMVLGSDGKSVKHHEAKSNAWYKRLT